MVARPHNVSRSASAVFHTSPSLSSTIGEGEFSKVKLDEEMSKVELGREIEILKFFKHPSIVRLYDVIRADKHIGTTQEHAPGK
ncbi:hypothetical protein BU17DRAFT_86601 [Hysterangium stoloniferum]|nr:hypothetical protein BU17DRAFT_86601 [Hysterangium stoloniferum]